MPRIRRVDTNGPGIRRQRRGRGFSYHEADGELITDADTVGRIKELAIPPAWTDVWISPHPRGHIQATGYDDAGRKQYLYHDAWREERDRLKFEEMLDFARALPQLRLRVEEGLGARGLVFDRVCSCAVRLLDLGLFRIGSDRYEDENESYGLTTLKNEHAQFSRGKVVFDYPSKSGQRSRHTITDRELIPLLRALAKREEVDGGLLVYRTGRSWYSLRSDQVNEFIKEEAGVAFSAKDFRTWNATVLSATFLAQHASAEHTKSARKRIANMAIRQTAEYLNNTPAVCRASYIDPKLFDRFNSGETVAPALARIDRGLDPGEWADRAEIELAVVRLLEG